jgi:hypothetical protein
LTSIISFIAPHTAVQVIAATMFAFVMLMCTVHVKPYREKSSQQLLTLSQMNIFLFLFTGRGILFHLFVFFLHLCFQSVILQHFFDRLKVHHLCFFFY